MVVWRWWRPDVLAGISLSDHGIGRITEDDLPVRHGGFDDDDALKNRMMFDSKVQRYIESYRKLWAAYQEARCEPWEAGDCVEPSLGDFIEILRKHGEFFIRDHGFVEIPEGWDGPIVSE